MLNAQLGCLVTAVAELADGRLVMMDVEKVLAETGHFNDELALKTVKPLDVPDRTVLMHSSISSEPNQQLGKAVWVDEYVSKFEPKKLSHTLARLRTSNRKE
jgi:hypothetical protein